MTHGQELLEAAVRLGGQQPGQSGMLIMRRWLRSEPTTYAIVCLNFDNADEIGPVFERAMKLGLTGFSDTIDLIVNGIPASPPLQELGPNACPYHGDVLKPSKKPGSLYCPTKLLDGSFCKYTVKL